VHSESYRQRVLDSLAGLEVQIASTQIVKEPAEGALHLACRQARAP
jgi:hypothetical protein